MDLILYLDCKFKARTIFVKRGRLNLHRRLALCNLGKGSQCLASNLSKVFYGFSGKLGQDPKPDPLEGEKGLCRQSLLI